jgi:nucleotide-binding universal stress UspA family protein
VKKGNSKILIATDGSEHSKAMIKEFADRTFTPATEVRIISAYEKSSYMMNTAPFGTMSEYYAEADKHSLTLAEHAIENAAHILYQQHPTLSISVAAIQGAPKSVIVTEADKFNADLIVVGAKGHSALEGFLLGSVSQAVALHANCSVEIVRVK